MPDNKSYSPKPEMDKAVRALLRKKAQHFGEALLKPECHRMIRELVQQGIFFVQFLQRESKRKKPSKLYQQFIENMFAAIAEKSLGRFADLSPEEFATFETILNGAMSFFAGKDPREILDGNEFVALQRRMFVIPKKRGPKNRQMLDEAYARHRKGETIKQIAQSLDPVGFGLDPDSAMQKIVKGIQRRKRQRASRT